MVVARRCGGKDPTATLFFFKRGNAVHEKALPAAPLSPGRTTVILSRPSTPKKKTHLTARRSLHFLSSLESFWKPKLVVVRSTQEPTGTYLWFSVVSSNPDPFVNTSIGFIFYTLSHCDTFLSWRMEGIINTRKYDCEFLSLCIVHRRVYIWWNCLTHMATDIIMIKSSIVFVFRKWSVNFFLYINSFALWRDSSAPD